MSWQAVILTLGLVAASLFVLYLVVVGVAFRVITKNWRKF